MTLNKADESSQNWKPNDKSPKQVLSELYQTMSRFRSFRNLTAQKLQKVYKGMKLLECLFIRDGQEMPFVYEQPKGGFTRRK